MNRRNSDKHRQRVVFLELALTLTVDLMSSSRSLGIMDIALRWLDNLILSCTFTKFTRGYRGLLRSREGLYSPFASGGATPTCRPNCSSICVHHLHVHFRRLPSAPTSAIVHPAIQDHFSMILPSLQ